MLEKYPLMKFMPWWRINEEKYIKNTTFQPHPPQTNSAAKIHWQIAEGFNLALWLLGITMMMVFFSVAHKDKWRL
jgi:hypothetical protein